MKKWMAGLLISAITVGTAMADGTNTVPWYKRMFGISTQEPAQAMPAVPVAAPAAAPAPAPEKARMHRPEGLGERPMLPPEQMEKMKAMKEQHEALMKLGEAARNEKDPVKKEELTKQIRAKVTEGADKMLAEQKKRLAQAEADLPKLKERLADAEKNKDSRIEEMVKRVLAGEPMRGPEGKRPEGVDLKKELKKEGKKAPAPAVQ